MRNLKVDDYTKLPKWASSEIVVLKRKIEYLEDLLDGFYGKEETNLREPIKMNDNINIEELKIALTNLDNPNFMDLYNQAIRETNPWGAKKEIYWAYREELNKRLER